PVTPAVVPALSLHDALPIWAADVPALVERAREGDARSVARLISLVEDASPAVREVAAALSPHTGHAQVLGLTGSPGVGKSTTTTDRKSTRLNSSHVSNSCAV